MSLRGRSCLAMPSRTVELIPNAARVLAALRNVGYSLNSAVADLIDNSIAAGATRVDVEFRHQRGCFRLSIRDNGQGMLQKQLLEAMRLGSATEYEKGSLGKFGMGLKTASLSQCRRLTVVSRRPGSRHICGGTWDLDHIDRTHRWELLHLTESRISQDRVFKSIHAEPGTIVRWESVDRLDAQYAAFEKRGSAENWVGRITDDLKLHLRMVFHRFLDGTAARGKPLEITFNGARLLPWDPFCRDEPNTVPLPPSSFSLDECPGAADVSVEPFVLPVQDGPRGFRSLKRWREAAGLLSWNDSQGYYVYREDRLIHYGGWLWTRAKDEHTKYARVAISFRAEHDAAFDISVHKAQIRLPGSLFQHLKTSVNPDIVKAAQEPYREGRRRGASGGVQRPSTRVLADPVSRVMDRHHVTVQAGPDGRVRVTNPNGGFVANPASAARRLKVEQKFAVETGPVPNGQLWNLICRPDGGFTVVLNPDHPFYQLVYDSAKGDSRLTTFIDTVLFSIAYSELRSANPRTQPLFSEVRETISVMLAEVATSLVAPASPAGSTDGGQE